jgi:hypothetical protein
MEPIKSYLTKEGWKEDWNKTKADFSRKGKTDTLDAKVSNESGNAAIPIIIGVAAMPLCAYAGSYVGEGIGWLWGNFVDIIPYVSDVAPWLAERSGLIDDASKVVDLNENLYQTTGAIGGFWGGLTFPWKALAAYYTEK